MKLHPVPGTFPTGRRHRARTTVSALALAAVTAFAAFTASGAATAEPLAQPVWLCRPGAPGNPCNQNPDGSPQSAGAQFTVGHPQSSARANLDSTVLDPRGGQTVDPLRPPNRPPVDCFYVYPTVDLESNPTPQTGSRPPKPTDVEANTVFAQVGRLIGGCRMFVPDYRQLSLPGLLGKNSGLTSYTLGEGDIEQAWDQYWNNDNRDPVTGRRRGVILLGHSQGSADLQTLIQHRIDGNAEITDHLVAAFLLGADTVVPIGHDRGDGDPGSTFQHLPVCRRPGAGAPLPTHCVVAFSTYNQPGGALLRPHATFGRADRTHEVACVNPAALLAGARADAATPVVPEFPSAMLATHFPNPSRRDYSTGFVRYPGRLTAQCLGGRDAEGTAHWLQVGGDNQLARPTDGTGLGLHVADWQLAQDDTDALAIAQASAWLATHPG